MVITIQKFRFSKAKPKVIQYRYYKNFNNRENLKVKHSITREYDDFEKAYLEVLDNHAPIKKKAVKCQSYYEKV